MKNIDIDRLTDLLPSGSGINSDWEYTEHRNGKITFKNHFHAMNEHGYYDGYMPFKFTVSLTDGKLTFLRIIANDKARNSFHGLKEYLEDMIDYALEKITLDQITA